jgi:hypothetical protein
MGLDLLSSTSAKLARARGGQAQQRAARSRLHRTRGAAGPPGRAGGRGLEVGRSVADETEGAGPRELARDRELAARARERTLLVEVDVPSGRVEDEVDGEDVVRAEPEVAADGRDGRQNAARDDHDALVEETQRDHELARVREQLLDVTAADREHGVARGRAQLEALPVDGLERELAVHRRVRQPRELLGVAHAELLDALDARQGRVAVEGDDPVGGRRVADRLGAHRTLSFARALATAARR